MKRYYPDYTGDDFLNWQEKENKWKKILKVE
jgi:hypothetical protein